MKQKDKKMKTHLKHKKAKLHETKTWGFHVVDYVNTKDGRPTEYNFGFNKEEAEKKYNEIINS